MKQETRLHHSQLLKTDYHLYLQASLCLCVRALMHVQAGLGIQRNNWANKLKQRPVSPLNN